MLGVVADAGEVRVEIPSLILQANKSVEIKRADKGKLIIIYSSSRAKREAIRTEKKA